MRTWPALEVTLPSPAPAHLADLVAAALDDFRPTAIEDAGACWRVFFVSPTVRDEAAAALSSAFAPAGLGTEILDVPDEDWARRSQADLGAITAGSLTVVPPWDPLAALPRPPGTIVILPSMGFGTGHHASTRLCLRLLQEIDVNGRRVLDAGTGSGVLAIAALRLGAAHVVAIDHDPDAIESARDNLGLNQIGTGIDLRLTDLRHVGLVEADAVLANLTAGLLLAACDALMARLRPGGHLIASGFTLDQEEAVRTVFEGPGFLASRASEDEWVGARFVKRT